MTTTEHADQPPEAPAATTAKNGLVYPGMGLLFVVLICCFTAWGIAADLTTPMVAGFKQIFDMNTFQASLVQLAYFGAYFLLAIPAALINQRFGYKAGLLSGVLLAAAGAIAFYPASKIMTYEAFLVALFAIAAGCSILETSANPYVLSLGPEETATRRLNFAQAFNPVGTNIGVLLAATLILPKLDEPMNMANLDPAQEQTIRAGQLGAVMGPYLGLGFVLIAIGLVIAIKKSPPIVEEYPDADMEGQRPLKILLSNKRYVYGVIAQFFNVAAQVCTWTYLIQYSQQALNGSLELGGYLLQVSLIVFLISRFIMTWVIGKVRATKVLLVLAALAVLLCVFADVLAERGRGGRRRRFVFLLVPDVPDDLRRRSSGARSRNEVRRSRTGDGHRRRGDHALDPGLPARRDQPGDLVHRSGRLLCRRRQFRRLRPEGDAPQGWRANSMRRYWIITLAIVLAACGGAGQKANFSEPTDRLEVVSWWVSPSEHPAFEVLLNAFRGGNPDVEVIDGAIAGGGGSNVQVALAARLRAGDPPDVWQTFLGSSLRAWVDAGRIVDVSSVYESTGLDRTMPATLLDAATYRVKAWGVPTGSHRGNVLWFSQRVLREAGVAPPGPGYTMEAFEADLAKVDASGKTALCLGSKDRFTSTELFENTLLGVLGTDGWARIRDDSFDWRGSQLRAGAHAVRRDRLPSRSGRGRPHVGSGGEEVGDWAVRVPVDERLRVRRTGREQGRRRQGFRLCGISRNVGGVPRHRGHVRRVGRCQGRGECHEVHGDHRGQKDIAGVQQGQGVGADTKRRRCGIAARLPATGVGVIVERQDPAVDHSWRADVVRFPECPVRRGGRLRGKQELGRVHRHLAELDRGARCRPVTGTAATNRCSWSSPSSRDSTASTKPRPSCSRCVRTR